MIGRAFDTYHETLETTDPRYDRILNTVTVATVQTGRALFETPLHASKPAAKLLGRMPDDISKDPRVYFAAERTFLAWVRTGIALMGFGFVVARFGLFLREIANSQVRSPVSAPGFSLWIGMALILIGVFVNISAVVRQGRLIRQLKRGEWDIQHQSQVGIGISVTLACVGIAMAIYLSVMR